MHVGGPFAVGDEKLQTHSSDLRWAAFLTCALAPGVVIFRGKRVKNMSTTGEKPGEGTYTCTTPGYGQVVVLDDSTDTLPPCPKCSGTDYRP